MFLFLFCLAARGNPIVWGDYPKCDGSGEAICECMKFLFDANADGNITQAEIDAKFPTLVDCPSMTLGSDKFMMCDINNDHVLNMDDWNHPNRTCLKTPGERIIACEVCARNGFTMTQPGFMRMNRDDQIHEYMKHQWADMQRQRQEEYVKTENFYAKKREEQINEIKNMRKPKLEKRNKELLYRHLDRTKELIEQQKKQFLG